MAETHLSQTDVLGHMERLLSSREYPKTICPSEVARALTAAELKACGASDWRSLMPAIRGILWNLREKGEVEILQKGLLVQGVELEDLKGPIRARKVSSNRS